MKLKLTPVLAGLMAAGAVTATASSASAYIVCNRAGDCWHSHDRAAPGYGPGYVRSPRRLVLSPRLGQGDPHYRWHEWHEGRGYWRDGAWVPR